MRLVLMMTAAAIASLPAALPQPARAQVVEKTGECTQRVQRSERYREGRYRVTSFYFVYSNTCGRPIRMHQCTTAASDAQQCTIGMFKPVDLPAYGSVELRGPERWYVHVIECPPGENLGESRSRVTQRSTVMCAAQVMASAAPEANPGAAFSSIGDMPSLSLPTATMRNATTVISADDYPPAMQRIGAEGRSVVALAVSPQGRATGCKVVQSSGFAELDRATCTVVMRRGRFTPATDASGNPVPSVYPEFKMAWANQ